MYPMLQGYGGLGMEELKISYTQIEKANEEIAPMKIGSKDYAPVNERVKAFRKVYPTGSIETDIENITEDSVRMIATIRDENGEIIATGRASEVKKGSVNANSMVENCETSAVGRALGMAGFGINSSIASGDDIERNKENMKQYEIYNKIFIREKDAVTIVKNSINELIRKMGIVKADLEDKIYVNLWTDLSSLNLSQFQKLEEKLKTVNMENNDWHDLYNQNLRLKDVTPEGQEVVYESSWVKFGKVALQMAGNDETLRNEIIDAYLNQGINLGD